LGLPVLFAGLVKSGAVSAGQYNTHHSDWQESTLNYSGFFY
jgi:hypothetical protein